MTKLLSNKFKKIEDQPYFAKGDKVRSLVDLVTDLSKSIPEGTIGEARGSYSTKLENVVIVVDFGEIGTVTTLSENFKKVAQAAINYVYITTEDGKVKFMYYDRRRDEGVKLFEKDAAEVTKETNIDIERYMREEERDEDFPQVEYDMLEEKLKKKYNPEINRALEKFIKPEFRELEYRGKRTAQVISGGFKEYIVPRLTDAVERLGNKNVDEFHKKIKEITDWGSLRKLVDEFDIDIDYYDHLEKYAFSKKTLDDFKSYCMDKLSPLVVNPKEREEMEKGIAEASNTKEMLDAIYDKLVSEEDTRGVDYYSLVESFISGDVPEGFKELKYRGQVEFKVGDRVEYTGTGPISVGRLRDKIGTVVEKIAQNTYKVRFDSSWDSIWEGRSPAVRIYGDELKYLEPPKLDVPELSYIESQLKPGVGMDREKKVKKTISLLKYLVKDMASSIYQLKLTDKQLANITDKVLKLFAKEISNITVTRVRDITEMEIGKEVKKPRGSI